MNNYRAPRGSLLVLVLALFAVCAGCASENDKVRKDEALTQYAVSKKMADGFRRIDVTWSSEPTSQHIQQFLDQNTVAWRAVAGADSRPAR